jgi:hypothetical protein
VNLQQQHAPLEVSQPQSAQYQKSMLQQSTQKSEHTYLGGFGFEFGLTTIHRRLQLVHAILEAGRLAFKIDAPLFQRFILSVALLSPTSSRCSQLRVRI